MLLEYVTSHKAILFYSFIILENIDTPKGKFGV